MAGSKRLQTNTEPKVTAARLRKGFVAALTGDNH
jgi:hypothetical protein